MALGLPGHGPDAEDAVQDATLTALRRIGDVRDPAAVGAWLRAIVRNIARKWRCPSGMTDTEWARTRRLLPVRAWLEGRGKPEGCWHRQIPDAIRATSATVKVPACNGGEPGPCR
ncbi:RNA polymerase sigma factor [Streptomyces sp. NBC_00118]|uniref:RNA polymerase sigma factor n=1 Tax=unclassified Streptomyces TaxID=2593676 RepID=UPI003870ED50